MKNLTEITGRVLLGAFFVMAGAGKIGASYAGTAGYMDSMGVPGALLPLVIGLEIIAGLMIITGFRSHWASYALAGFSVVAAFIFHFNFSDQMQSIMFMKNIAIAGALLIIATKSVGEWSIDSFTKK